MSLSPQARAELQRHMDRIARRILDDHVTGNIAYVTREEDGERVYVVGPRGGSLAYTSAADRLKATPFNRQEAERLVREWRDQAARVEDVPGDDNQRWLAAHTSG